MLLFALGLNHDSAELQLRERLAFAKDDIPAALQDLKHSTQVQQAALLSTCNRTELYGFAEKDAVGAVQHWLSKAGKVGLEQLKPHLYEFHDEAAIRHMIRVAAGLDSMVLGEPQILGQMKQAHALAKQASTANGDLDRLFQHVFGAVKTVRSETSLGAGTVSVASVALDLAARVFDDFSAIHVLAIGAGEMVELALRSLKSRNVRRMIIANRNRERAMHLALELGAQPAGLDELPTLLPQADLVLSSTSAPGFVLGLNEFQAASKARRRKPMLALDLAVPRDIDPLVRDLSDVYLYTIDDLRHVVDSGLAQRQAAAQHAEPLIAAAVGRFSAWQRTQSTQHYLQAAQQHAHDIKKELLRRAKLRCKQGEPVEEVLDSLAEQLCNRLLHAPLTELRSAATQNDTERLELCMRLMGLTITGEASDER
jgi:glutamyl-tRNA reductase